MITKVKNIIEEEYSDCNDSLKIISYDDDNKIPLCDSDKKFLNYDKIVQKFYSGQATKSPDLIEFKEDKIVFVEFKNGNLKKKHDELKLKGIEGAFIALFEIVLKKDNTITFEDILKLKKEYIIVYNGEKNTERSRVAGIANHLRGTRIRFGLERYSKTFFNNISTISDSVYKKNVI